MSGLEYPPVGADVKLKADDTDGVFTCRVSAREGDDLTLTVAQGPTDRPGPGAGATLRWQSGARVAQVFMVVLSAAGPTVVVGASGPSAESQRRRYVRVPVPGTVKVRLGAAPCEADIVNLSEGGLFCIGAFGDRPPTEGQYVGVSFVIDGFTIECRGRVIRTTRANDGTRRQVAMSFVDLEDRVTDRIRSYLFAEQRRQLARASGMVTSDAS